MFYLLAKAYIKVIKPVKNDQGKGCRFVRCERLDLKMCFNVKKMSLGIFLDICPAAFHKNMSYTKSLFISQLLRSAFC